VSKGALQLYLISYHYLLDQPNQHSHHQVRPECFPSTKNLPTNFLAEIAIFLFQPAEFYPVKGESWRATHHAIQSANLSA
jgi:hypothetical protein